MTNANVITHQLHTNLKELISCGEEVKQIGRSNRLISMQDALEWK